MYINIYETLQYYNNNDMYINIYETLQYNDDIKL